ALAQGLFGALALADLTGRARDDLDVALLVQHRTEDVVVVAKFPGGTGVRGFVAKGFTRVEHLLNLTMEALRQIFWIPEVVEILPYGILKFEAPQVEQSLVDVQKSAFTIEQIHEIGDGGQGGVEHASSLFQLTV